MIKIGSLFSGIGGFELGLERAIPQAQTIWQVEQDKFCQSILHKHWPNAKIYNDVRNINKQNVAPIDILCGGFPCQDISIAGKGKGIIKDETRSGLWWEMHRLISELGPRIAIMENVPAITFRGGLDVIGSLAQIGYDAEWVVISAREFGAPHKRERWFCVAYPNSERLQQTTIERVISIDDNGPTLQQRTPQEQSVANTNCKSAISISQCTLEKTNKTTGSDDCYTQEYTTGTGYWGTAHPEPLIRRVDDGVSNRLDGARLKALGNAIVPQCSEWIGKQIVKSGLLDNIL